MLNLLAFDMSMQACSVALLQGESLLTMVELAARQQSRHILSMIARLLAEAGISFSALDAIAFGCGPGSFTGVRLAASVAQGIAFARNLPVLPISTMQALAQGVCTDFNAEIIWVALNAHCGEIYAATYQKTVNKSIVELIMQERRCLPEEILFSDNRQQSYAAAGDAWHVYADILHRQLPHQTEIYADYYPHAKEIAAIAKVDFEHNIFVSPANALPSYLHRENMWKKLASS